jgi:hypothetical protein
MDKIDRSFAFVGGGGDFVWEDFSFVGSKLRGLRVVDARVAMDHGGIGGREETGESPA